MKSQYINFGKLKLFCYLKVSTKDNLLRQVFDRFNFTPLQWFSTN